MKSLRGAALLVGSLFALSQVASVVHLATGAHAICAEHGEEIDVDTPAAAAQATPVAFQGAQLERGRAESQHDHAHCATIAGHRISALSHSASLHAPALPASLALSLEATTAARDARETFRLAPKASPPRA